MNRLGLPLAVALVALVNGIVLAGVAYNRAAPSESTVLLTHREMPVAASTLSDESSGIALRFATTHWSPVAVDDTEPYAEHAWLDEAKLASLGFDVKLPGDGFAGEPTEKWPPARRAYALVEFGGNALQAWEKRLRQGLEQTTNDYTRTSIERELREGSRLFIIDVDRDPAALRARHPVSGSTFILPASVSATVVRGPPSGKARLRGHIELLVPEVNVPRRMQAALGPIQRAKGSRYRPEPIAEAPYQVELRVGHRYEPWIADLVPGHAGELTQVAPPAAAKGPPESE